MDIIRKSDIDLQKHWIKMVAWTDYLNCISITTCQQNQL